MHCCGAQQRHCGLQHPWSLCLSMRGGYSHQHAAGRDVLHSLVARLSGQLTRKSTVIVVAHVWVSRQCRSSTNPHSKPPQHAVACFCARGSDATAVTVAPSSSRCAAVHRGQLDAVQRAATSSDFSAAAVSHSAKRHHTSAQALRSSWRGSSSCTARTSDVVSQGHHSSTRACSRSCAELERIDSSCDAAERPNDLVAFHSNEQQGRISSGRCDRRCAVAAKASRPLQVALARTPELLRCAAAALLPLQRPLCISLLLHRCTIDRTSMLQDERCSALARCAAKWPIDSQEHRDRCRSRLGVSSMSKQHKSSLKAASACGGLLLRSRQ